MYNTFTLSIRWKNLVLVGLGYLSCSSVFGQMLSERQAKMRSNVQNDKNVASFVLSEQLKTPSFINFKDTAPYSADKAKELIGKFYLFTDTDELRLQSSTPVPGGLIVERYKQYRSGIKVEHSAYVVTIKDSKIFSINSESFDLPAGFSVKPQLQEQLAKSKVLNFTNAKRYAWQELQEKRANARIGAEEAVKLDELINQYKPKGELVIAKAFYQGGGPRLAYKYDIYATKPLSRNLVYIDAATGEILLVDPIIKHAGELQKNKEKQPAKNSAQITSLNHIGFNNTKRSFAFGPLKTSSSLGSGKTRYAGVRNIYTTKISVPLLGTTDPNNTLAPLTYSGIEPRVPIVTAQDVYILKDDTRGGGVETFDLNGIGGLPISVPGLEGTALAFVDRDNIWKDETAVGTFEDLMRGPTQPPAGGGPDEALNDDMAIDAHWGAEMVYDYWKERHGRLSYDNANASIRSYVHYGPAYDNAFWNGSVMTYGDGSGGTAGGFKPLVSLDVCGHEIGHGVCSFTADLVYAGESGAMNEGLSDIWAAALENYVKLNVDGSLPYQPFQVGEQIDPTAGNVGLRRMDDPKAKGNPDTYGGINWTTVEGCTPTLVNDQCGVHNNSGVLNKWFYLMVKGPSKTTGSPLFTDDGINDNGLVANTGDNYGILTGFKGLDFEKAEKITYLMELMLTPNATYAEARIASINAAKILYGDCSQEEETTTDAWFAVNVGDAFTACTAPLLSVKATVTDVGEFAGGACDRYTDYAINISLTAAQTAPVTVNFARTGGTLGANEYHIIPSSLTYNANEKGLKTVILRIFDDAMVEGDEAISITATSALTSLNTTFGVNIIDDDVAPVIGGAVTLLNENFESTPSGSIPANWGIVNVLTPSPVTWKVLAHPLPSVGLPIGGVLYWTGKRAVIEAPLTPGLATYNTLAAAQTILKTPLINALGLSDVKVSFVFSAGGEPACDPACDYGQLVYSYDGVNFKPFTAESTPLYAQLTDQTVNTTLPQTFNNKQFYLGFLWNNDENAGLVASIAIDNVVVTADGRSIEGDINAAVVEKVFPESGKSSYFYSTSDHQLMASITSSSADLGCVSTSLIDAGVGSTPFLTGKRSKKAFLVTPTSNSSATYTIAFYYKKEELETGFTGLPSTLKLVKTNASTINETNSTNYELVTPTFEDQSTKGYYKYSYTFSGFSKFFLAEDVSGPLPVTLVGFKAEPNENTVDLSWITAAEENSSYFEVERSMNAVDFGVIGKIKGKTNSVDKNIYQLNDQTPFAGVNYYRLKMVDLDGSFAYSKIVSAKFGSDKSIVVFPNPVSSKVTVKLEGKSKGTISLTNVSGNLMKRKVFSGNSAELDVSKLPDGIYILNITREEGSNTFQKIVVAH